MHLKQLVGQTDIEIQQHSTNYALFPPAKIPLMVTRMLNFPVGCPLKEILLSVKQTHPEAAPANIVLETIRPNLSPSPLLVIESKLPPLKEKKPTMSRNPPKAANGTE